jgi:hypothetical protein
MNAPVIAGQEYLLRVWLQPEAGRLVQLINWSIYTLDDALREMRALARWHARRAKLTVAVDPIADTILLEEWERQDDIHAKTLVKLTQLAVRVFNRGGSPEDATVALRQAAFSEALEPPTALLEQAMHLANIEHRRSVSWQRRREAMA